MIPTSYIGIPRSILKKIAIKGHVAPNPMDLIEDAILTPHSTWFENRKRSPMACFTV